MQCLSAHDYTDQREHIYFIEKPVYLATGALRGNCLRRLEIIDTEVFVSAVRAVVAAVAKQGVGHASLALAAREQGAGTQPGRRRGLRVGDTLAAGLTGQELVGALSPGAVCKGDAGEGEGRRLQLDASSWGDDSLLPCVRLLLAQSQTGHGFEAGVACDGRFCPFCFSWYGTHIFSDVQSTGRVGDDWVEVSVVVY